MDLISRLALPESFSSDLQGLIGTDAWPIVARLINHLNPAIRDSPVKLTRVPLMTILGVSFQSPRNKLNIQVFSDSISLVTPKDGKVVLDFALTALTYIIKLSTPQKQKPSTTYALFSKSGIEAVLTLEDGKKLKTSSSALSQSDFESILLSKNVKAFNQPSRQIFMSTNSQKQSGKLVFHVDCNLKMKETYLFLLDIGIFYGLSKSDCIFFKDVMGVETTVRLKTFDLNVQVVHHDSLSSEPLVVSFENIDKSEFDGVARYISESKLKWRSAVAGASKENPIDVDALLPTEFISSEDDDFVGQSSGDSLAEDYDSQYNTDSDSGDSELGREPRHKKQRLDQSESDDEEMRLAKQASTNVGDQLRSMQRNQITISDSDDRQRASDSDELNDSDVCSI